MVTEETRVSIVLDIVFPLLDLLNLLLLLRLLHLNFQLGIDRVIDVEHKAETVQYIFFHVLNLGVIGVYGRQSSVYLLHENLDLRL